MANDKTIINRFNSSLATDPLRSFRFLAEFTAANDGVFSTSFTSGWVGGFTSIEGLSITTQAITYREGGYNTTVHQIPGMTTFTPVTFSRGVLSGNDQAITWMRGLFAAAAGEGLAVGAGKGFRVNVKIYVQDHPNATVTSATTKMAFEIHNAWITGLNYTGLDATNGAILFETMQLVHEGISVFFTDAAGNRNPAISSQV
jgi:phage tail-like protein